MRERTATHLVATQHLSHQGVNGVAKGFVGFDLEHDLHAVQAACFDTRGSCEAIVASMALDAARFRPLPASGHERPSELRRIAKFVLMALLTLGVAALLRSPSRLRRRLPV